MDGKYKTLDSFSDESNSSTMRRAKQLRKVDRNLVAVWLVWHRLCDHDEGKSLHHEVVLHFGEKEMRNWLNK